MVTRTVTITIGQRTCECCGQPIPVNREPERPKIVTFTIDTADVRRRGDMRDLNRRLRGELSLAPSNTGVERPSTTWTGNRT